MRVLLKPVNILSLMKVIAKMTSQVRKVEILLQLATDIPQDMFVYHSCPFLVVSIFIDTTVFAYHDSVINFSCSYETCR